MGGTAIPGSHWVILTFKEAIHPSRVRFIPMMIANDYDDVPCPLGDS
jgi:hypothetical protein